MYGKITTIIIKMNMAMKPGLIEELMKSERFVLPRESNFYTLHERRFEPGNGERIDMALHALEEANGTKLQRCRQKRFPRYLV
nr:hypothetical protein GPGIFMOB_00178 [Acinetobacter gerneri]